MPLRFKPARDVKIDPKLLLDSKNPRIPLDKRSLSQEDLTAFVAETYNSIAIAKSIVTHEYFPSEPLIAIRSGTSRKLIVVEGNRRLSALKLLLFPKLRDHLVDRSEWDTLDVSRVRSEVPVIVATSREDVAPIIGYRHISGIQPWDAYAKARYIADHLKAGRSFEQTAEDVGETSAEVRANYRNYQISKQARSSVSDEIFDDLTNRFGVFTRAMQSTDLRAFIGAPPPGKVAIAKKPVPNSKKAALKEFVGYLYGPDAIVTDSRELTKLGKVLASSEGLKALRAGQSLDEAHIASGGFRDRLIGRLSNAARSLRAAEPDIPAYRRDQEVKDLIGECEEALEDVKRAQGRRAP